MRCLFILFFIACLSSCFSQNKVALVTTKKGETAYYSLQKGITYVEKKPDPAAVEGICKFNNGFARVRRLSQFYFIDETGNPVFNTPYEKAEDFHENFAQVKIDGKWGFINRKGEMAIKPQFYEAGPFSFGLSEVALSPKGKHGFIDTTGNFVIQPQFDNAMPFIGDRAWVSLNAQWGLIDKQGKFIITPTYKVVKDVFDPFDLWVSDYDLISGMINQKKQSTGNLAWIISGGKWGLINKSGKTLVPAIYSEVKDIHEGYTWVKKDALWGLIDSTGNYLIKPDERNPLIYASNATFKIFSGFHNGLLRYQSRNLYGYLDKQLNVAIPAKYDKVSDFKNGLACVYQDGYCGLIDVKGKIVIPINYREISITNDDLFPAKDDNGDWGYLNLKNEWVVKPQFKNVSPFVITYYN
jgi:hypothetical protein